MRVFLILKRSPLSDSVSTGQAMLGYQGTLYQAFPLFAEFYFFNIILGTPKASCPSPFSALFIAERTSTVV